MPGCSQHRPFIIFIYLWHLFPACPPPMGIPVAPIYFQQSFKRACQTVKMFFHSEARLGCIPFPMIWPCCFVSCYQRDLGWVRKQTETIAAGPNPQRPGSFSTRSDLPNLIFELASRCLVPICFSFGYFQRCCSPAEASGMQWAAPGRAARKADGQFGCPLST